MQTKLTAHLPNLTKLISLVVSAECSLMLMFYLKLILENALVEKCAYAIRAQYYKACKQRMLLSWNKLPANCQKDYIVATGSQVIF